MYFLQSDERPQWAGNECCDLEWQAACTCLCTLDEVRQLVCSNLQREKLWLGLESFLVRTQAGMRFSHLNLAGAFASRVEHPREIELFLQTRASYGPAALAAIAPLLELGLDEIYRNYRIRLGFWIEGAPKEMCGYRNAISSMTMRRDIVRVPLQP